MKYNKKYIWYSFIISLPFVLFLLFLVISAVFNTENEPFEENILNINSSGELLIWLGIIFIAYIIVSFIICNWQWKKITYSINEDNITLEEGIFFKKRLILPYDKMHAVTIDRNIIARIFGLAKLSIDSGNTISTGSNEIEIYDLLENVNTLEKELKSKIDQYRTKRIKNKLDVLNENLDTKEEMIKELDYNFDAKRRKDMVITSLAMHITTDILFLIYLFTMVIIILINGFNLGVIFIGFLVYFVIIMIIISIARLSLLIQYYKYKVVYNEDEIIITYGFFHIRKCVLAKNRIKGIIVKQDVIQKKKGFASINVELIGLMDNTDSTNIENNKIIPFLNINEVNSYLEKIDNQYKVIDTNIGCKKKSFMFFNILPLIIIFICFAPFILGFISSYISLIFLGVYLFIAILVILLNIYTYRHQGLAYDENNIYFSNGTLIKKFYIIPSRSIVSIGTFTTPWRSKNGIVSIYIDYYTSKFNSRKTISMLDEKKYIEFLLRFEATKNKYKA